MKSNFLSIAAVAAAAAGLGAIAPASADTLADALAKAYSYDPSLQAQRAALQTLDENEIQERSAALGSVDAQASYGWQNTDSGSTFVQRSRNDSDPFSLGIAGSIPLYAGGRIENGTQSAIEGVRSGRADLIGAEQDVLLDAVTAYTNVKRDIALVGVARSNVRVIGEQLRAAQDRFEVGEVTRTDVSQAEARLAASRSTLASVVGSLAQSRQAYLVSVGELPEELEELPPLPPLPESEEASIALAEAQHPALVAARHTLKQSEYEVKRALGIMLPSVSLEAQAGYSDQSVLVDGGGALQDGNSVEVGVSATMPLWSGGRNPSLVREAQARVAQQQALIHNTARQIRQLVSNAWSGLQVARTSITAARQQIRAAQIAFDGVQEEATLGARTTLDVLDADQELQSARAELISSLRDEYVAGYTLLSAVGSLTVRHLGLDVTPYDPDEYRNRVQADVFGYTRDETTQWRKPWRP